MPKVDRKFRKLSVANRLKALHSAGLFDDADLAAWREGVHELRLEQAERMVENVVGRFCLPQGLAVNFPLNGRYYQVPMVVEEPSVIAALSFAALLADKAGGFRAQASEPRISGQVQLLGIPDMDAATRAIRDNDAAILAAANASMPRMVARGGGAQALHFTQVRGQNSGEKMLVVDISINTCDAMGANQVNSVCEAIAPMLEQLTGGWALLKILSNLADEAIATAEVTLTCAVLASADISGEAMRDRIVIANDLALADPKRAATHNKGIMNGIDAVALATGNDWRSIEAAAHAYAAREGQYRALTDWRVGPEGLLQGRIRLPLKVGTVGGSLLGNPAVAPNLKLLGLTSATELAALLAAVGLAQNFAALRALCSVGIQQGHMRMHARSVALAAKVPDALFERVVNQMVADNDIKVTRAQELMRVLAEV